MAMSLLPLNCLHVALIFLLLSGGDCFQTERNLCDPTCSGFLTPDLPYQRGVRYAYRYSSTISTAFQGSGTGRNGLALDCVVDIEVVSKCHLTLQIRNPQIRRLSHQKEHSVQRLKKLRESLERARLKFSLQGGKVTALCLQEGEQVWALNMKRALLSMFQTSRMASKQELVQETDVYGTCTSRYERRGPVLLKTRDLTECHQARLASFWPHSVPVAEDTSVQSELHCVQKHESTLMQEVNCTEAVSMTTWSETTRVMRTQTASSLVLLRAQPVTPPSQDSVGSGVPTDLQFEDERAARPRRDRASALQDISQTVRTLCSLTSDPKMVSQEFLQLVFQLRDLSRPRLRTLWEEASFKCRNDWQPLLEALAACGSEGCIALLSDLMRNRELEEQQAQAFLSTIALIPHPTPQMIDSINVFLEVPEVHSKALLSGSSLVYQLCQRSHTSCGDLPQVQTFINRLEEILKGGTKTENPTQGQTLFYALKSVGNLGLSAPVFVPLLNHFMLGRSSPLELRLAAVRALRRYPCSVDRAVLLQLYRSSREDPEVRIAAYQQLLRCPSQDLFEAVKMTLKSETSSQVGSYVWSHLTNLLRSEDPMKQTLIESLPEDIISRDFESEFLKYSSYADYTVSSGIGITNVETSLVFSPKSFLPRSVAANLTVYFHGRAHNLLEVEVHGENAENLVRNFFGHGQHESEAESVESKEVRMRRGTEDGHKEGKEGCLNRANRVLDRAKAMLFGSRRTETSRPKCWIGVKVFGNELSVLTCDDLYQEIDQLSLSVAGLAVKLLKGQEVQLNHRAVLMTEELLLPSLSGLPVKLGVNMTSLFSLRLKGNVNYRDTSHFSLTGYIKPNAHVALSARMGVDGALGYAAVEWVSELRSSTSLDGSVQLQEGQDLRVMLNTPEDVMDIISISSRVFQLSGDLREEIRGPKTRVQKTTCTLKTWSKMVGWQLCSNASYPVPAEVFSLPPPGPVSVSLRLLKLDRGLHYYLLEAAYSLLTQRGSWLPREASLHLLLATPQSSVLRDMSLDVNFSPHRLLLRVTHPLKTILIQGQLEQDRRIKSGKLELLIDGVHSYILGLVDTQDLQSEQKTRYHVEAKMAPDEHPVILSANVTRSLGRQTSFAATVKNVFSEPASLSAVLERRRDGSTKQYSVETELLLPGVLGTRMLGLMEQRGSTWNSALRLKYGLGGNARNLLQECYTSQRMRSERDANLTNVMRADHEFYCSNTAPVNHKIHLRHEESHSHVKSTLDVSYGKHWDEINNKRTLFLSQSFKNQSTPNHTSYALEFNLQVPEKNLNYRTQLLHSHLRTAGSESSTHLKINYNDLMPLVAGIHWKSPSEHSLQKKWEGMFNMDTPWLHVYTAHKLSQLQQRTFRLTSELTVSKWLSIRNLLLEAFLMDGSGEKEARLKVHTPAVTYIRAAGWGVAEKQTIRASASVVTLWTPLLRGNFSLENSKLGHALHMTSTFGKQNLSLSAALNNVDKVLLRRQVTLKVTHQRPKSPTTEMELEGVMEVLRRDNKMYQKSAMIRLRQPFRIFPHTLLLRETFTVDLLKGLYTLESKARFHGNGEIVHVLTLGYRPPSPFVCSTLLHPFSSDIVPSDSQICLTFTSNQTSKEVRGTIHVSNKEMLHLFGQVRSDSRHPSQRELKVRGNFSHRFTLQLPSFAAVEADVCWSPKNNSHFDYQAKGKLRVEGQECRISVQLNGSPENVGLYSSLKHPFKSRLPKLLEVKANVSAIAGHGSSSVQVRADGKDRVKLDASIFHFLQRESNSVGLTVNVSQRLFPSASDLHLSMAANASSENVSLRGFYQHGHESLLAQVRGSLKNSPGFQLAVSGDLRNSIAHFAHLPPVLGLDAALQQSDVFAQGQIRVGVMESPYRLELRHHAYPADSSDSRRKMNASTDWLCAWLGSEHLCVNVSRKWEDWETGEVHARLFHSSRLLNGTGVPADNGVKLRWAQGVRQLSVLAEVLAGGEHVRTEFNGGRADQETPQWEYLFKLSHQAKALRKRGIPNSIRARAHYQLQTEGLEAGLTLHSEDRRMVDGLFRVGSKNGTAMLGVSLRQQLGLLPEVLQMNCSGDAAADRLSAHCHGNLAGHPFEDLLPPQTSANVSIARSGCSTHLSAVLQAEGQQRGQLNLRVSCQPSLHLDASVRHSIDAVTKLGFPPNGGIILKVSPAHLPGVEASVELGPCHFHGICGLSKSSQREGETSSYTVNVTNYCPALQGTLVPVSLALHGHLAAAPSHRAITSALRVDNHDLFLELSQSGSSPQLSGTLTHSLPGLRSRGVPQAIAIRAALPGAHERAGTLFIKAGTCSIRSSRITESAGGGQWLWALESKCPILQAHLNGSVSVDPRGIWTATVDSDLEGKRVFLSVRAKAWPELSLKCELSHSLPALENLPQHGRLRVTARAGNQRYETEAVLQTEGCAVQSRGLLEAQTGLRGSLWYLNNCSVIQEWGSPDSLVSSGFLAVSPALAESQISVAMDGAEIQTSVALKKNREIKEAWVNMSHSVALLRKVGLPGQAGIRVNSASHANGSFSYTLNCSAGSQKIYKKVSVTKMPETMRLRGRFQHTVNYLEKMGIPANNSIQAELGSAEEKALTLQSEFGGQQAGVRLMLKCLPVTKEIRGTLWHSWSWLRDSGFPHNTEFMGATQGVLARLQSRAQVVVDGRSLLTSGLNISSADGRLSLLLSVSPPASNQTQPSLAATVSAQLKGPLRSASADVHCHDWRVQTMADIQGWGAHGGSREARLTLKHTLEAHTNPALQVEAWGRLTDSQLRCSIAVNPALSTSLALILQGNHLLHSKDLMVKVVQNIPSLLLYLPPQLSVSSQLNQSRSAVAGSVEVLSGRKRRLFAQGELAALDGGYRQAAEFRHSFPQVKALPRTVTVETLYETRNWSYHVQHGAAWGNQKFTLSGLYAAPPTLDMGNQTLRVQINSVPRRTSMEAVLERSLRGRLDSVSLSWMRHGQQEQVKALSSWSHTDEVNETKLELRQPFTSTLNQLSLHTLSQQPQKGQFSSQQTHLWWKSAVPVNVSVILNKQWQSNSSRGQACALFSTQQMEVSSLKGCFSVSQEGNSYTQNSELRWNNKNVKQGLKYQRAAQGMHNLQFSLGLDKVSPAPCPSHSFLVKIQTNLRDRLEHTALFGLCPLQPALLWSGSHRVNIGEELFHSQTRLSTTGRPQLCSFVVTVTDASTAHGSNISLFSGSRMGNWSMEVGASAVSWPRGSGLLMHASLDRREKMWMNGSLEGRCLRSTAGFRKGPDLGEDITAVACVGTNGSWTLDVQEKVGASSPETVGVLSLGSANQRLTLRAKACLERLAAIEARIHDFSSQTGNKLLHRIKTLQDLILEFRRQHLHSPLLRDLTSVGLRAAQWVQDFQGGLGGGLVPLWQDGPLHRFATETLPHVLGLLQHASLLGQQELRKPLATLAGVYQDVRGQKPEELWREAVSTWAGWLLEVTPDLLGNPQLRPLARAGLGAFSAVLEAAGQHTYLWLENRLALALSGVRKRLASVYKLSPSECSAVLSLPLPALPWSEGAPAGLMEVLLEEWLLRPLQSLATIRPVAEFYRLKRKMMDSPFRHQALLVADQFAVTFDGHLRPLPDSCALLLAQDVGADSSFTLLLNADSQSYVSIGLSNDTVSVQRNGQVRVNCNETVSHTFHGNDGLAVRVRSNFMQLSNQNGVSLSCDLLHKVCSFTLDGWLHGRSAGLLGTNDNEAGNDSPLPDGSQAENPERLWQSWLVGQEGAACAQPPRVAKHFTDAATSPMSCTSLFSSPDSPLSSCFRVVDPGQFLSVCELIFSRGPCRLAHAFVHLCQQNYIPLEVPAKCLRP